MLSESLLRRRLEERGLSPWLILLPETGSTNDDAKALAREYPPSPVLIAASRQTGGRGRRGRTFLSPEGGLHVLPVSLPQLSHGHLLIVHLVFFQKFSSQKSKLNNK